MAHKLYIDIETYSAVDLRKSNAYRYSADPSFLMLMAAYALDDEPVQLVFGADCLDIPHLWDEDTVIRVAHNASFERICYSALLHRQHELEPLTYLDPAAWHDTQALAGVHGYPQKLGELARALGGEQKDEAGTRLISLFCKPNRQGKRNLPEDYPKEWEDFGRYCVQDVETLRSVDQKLPGWPTQMEQRVYLADQGINDRGIKVDVEMAARAVETAESNAEEQTAEIIQLTGIENPNSGQQMAAWLRDQGVQVPNLQKATVDGLLAGDTLPPLPRRVLEIRQELALVAAKKYTAALDRVNADDRLRGSFHYFGAHTGRWAGRGVQLQNLPSATLGEKDDPDDVVERKIAAGVLDLKMGAGADSNTLKALVRAMFTGPFTVVDYSAIEARVVAWLAGEQWALDAFAQGRDIYVETAQRMSTPGNTLTRKEGKVAVLALGFNGGINSLRVMGADGSDDALKFLVRQWRNANPAIVELWANMQEAFRHGGPVGDLIYVEKDGADRYIRLPSGRAIGYHDLRSRWVEKWGDRIQQISYADPKNLKGRVDTYGGRLVENITQAVARDVLAEAIVRLDDNGYRVVGHVHDEILVEGAYQVPSIARLMSVSPEWADGLPLNGEGYNCRRYRKG